MVGAVVMVQRNSTLAWRGPYKPAKEKATLKKTRAEHPRKMLGATAEIVLQYRKQARRVYDCAILQAKREILAHA